MKKLCNQIKNCDVCLKHLEHGVNPVFAVSSKSKVAIIGHAPGRIVHNSGIPWDDKSGERLRDWLEVDKEEFYQAENFAIMPMSFCYPGTGKTGDLPPRKECAPLWHEPLMQMMPQLKLKILIGQYAQAYYLGKEKKKNLTETVRSFNDFLPQYLPLPHPSPRNNIWLKKNRWFEEEVLPSLRKTIKSLLYKTSEA